MAKLIDKKKLQSFRILVADDEIETLDLYCQALGVESDENRKTTEEIGALADRLFSEKGKSIYTLANTFEIVTCKQGDEAVEIVKQSLAEKRPFAIAFIDIRMPPGPDGVWAAERIRSLDPYIEIVMVTGFSDIHPLVIARRIPPPHKLLYIQKPFHPLEIFQFATSLSAKWEMEQKLKHVELKKQELEIQLRRSQKLEAIGTLASGIAHDFNNILSSIIGNAEIALRHELSENDKARYSMEQILKAGHRARALVRQIVTFSHQKDQELKPLQLTPIIKETIKALRSTLPPNIQIRHYLMTDKDIVLCEPFQIQQILMNLATNAIYAMRNTGGTLEIRLTDTLSMLDMEFKDGLTPKGYGSKPQIKLSVSDTGEGMSQSVLERIFEPYFTTKPRGEGTGLGLSVVHGMVKAMNGIIRVQSEPGKGTVFTIFLPMVEARQVSELTAKAEVNTGNERILLVENEEIVLDMTKRMLESLGYQVTAMTKSVEALNLFQSNPNAFDLVITDMGMPDLSGDQLSKEILLIRPDIPIILCTGYTEIISEEKAKSIGIRELILKPILMTDMAQAVRKHLKKK